MWLRIADLNSYTYQTNPDYYWDDSATISSWSLFGSIIEPITMTVGSVNDAYYLGAISAMAENSERIKKLFYI